MKYADKFFKSIRQGNLHLVQELLEKEPELIAAVAKAKCDAGLSPLQVALKTGSVEIAELLLDRGSDVHFMEGTFISGWRAPVVHDAIDLAVMHSRWNTVSPLTGEVTLYSTKEASDRAFGILQHILSIGADGNQLDSYGNSGVWRFCLQARQILPRSSESQDRFLTPELLEDLCRIYRLLVQTGADLSHRHPSTERTIFEEFSGEPLERILGI